ncbi:MAG TPA: hypothetical protein VF725_08060 [Ktedonobacterales bacterium]
MAQGKPGLAAGKGRRRLRAAGRLLARVALAATLLLSLFLSLTPTGRAATRAAVLLPALIGASEPGVLLLAGDPIHHTQRVIPSDDGPVYLDTWAPTTPPPPLPGSREGLLLIPGVGDNRGVEQLVNLAESLARAGIVTMSMTTDTLISYQLAPTTVDAVVEATLALQRYPGVGRGAVGIIGFSAGGSLGALAAADPRIRDTLAFVLSFGGYYDARSLLRDLGRRTISVDGKLVAWNPDPVPVQTLANTLSPTLPSLDYARIVSGFNPNDGVYLPPGEVAQLTPVGRAAYHLIVGDEPDQVDANLAALTPAGGDALLTALSPSAAVGQIHAPVYLLHDQSDIYVPFTESRDFAATLTREGHRHEFVEFSIFAHVEVKSGLGVGPELRDGLALYRVLLLALAPSA